VKQTAYELLEWHVCQAYRLLSN